jgi:hypothetical protein
MFLGAGDLTVLGVDEDLKTGWTGRLAIEGDELKLLFFIHLAASGEPSADRRVWEILVRVPEYERPGGYLEGVFELELDRPLPGVMPE